MTMAKSKSSTRTNVTVRDVAKLAGVSQSTVSRVLNPNSDSTVSISEETIRRVQEAAAQLGYRPNLAARGLRGQRTQLIAVMAADIANPYYHIMLRKIQEVARAREFDVIFADTNHDPHNEHLFIEGILRRPVDGVILMPYHLKESDVERLVDRTGVPVVVVSRRYRYDGVDHVYADDGQGAYDMTRWLIDQRSYRRIAFIGVPNTSPGERRLHAFWQAMSESGLPVPDEYVKSGDFTSEAGQRAMSELMELPEPPTAVFACNDLMALGCIIRARAMGLDVPRDVAVVGFDDIPQASWISPKLTTVSQHPLEIGQRLVQALFERIDGIECGPGRNFKVPCHLVIRESA